MKKAILIIITSLFFIGVKGQTSPFFNSVGMEGPDAPDVQLTGQGNGIKIDISNSPISNNFNENYSTIDTSIHNGYPFFDFQGYLVYQVLADTINPWDNFFDTTKMKFVAQSDIADSVDTLTNHYLDTITANCDSIIMVQGNNTGLEHSYLLNTDAFTGNAFQPGIKYCFYVFAYAHNGNKIGVDCNKPWQSLISIRKGNGGGVSAVCATYFPVGINENDNSLKFRLYPNPSSNVVELEFEEKEEQINLSVLNIHGQQVLSNEYKNTENIRLNISDLSSGIYFAKIITNKGNKTVKFIKE